MIFKDIPKYVINLKRRPERLKHISNEMSYINWDHLVHDGVDTNSHVGCTLSHYEIIKEAKIKGFDNVMIIEDDCVFMPYAHSLIEDIEKKHPDLDFGIINLAPTHNRPVNKSNYEMFLDTTNFPPKEDHHRGVFATNMLIYNNKTYDDVLHFVDSGLHKTYAIDDYLYSEVMSKKQSYCPILPIAPQKASWSDVSGGEYNNFHTQTYNWNLYCPTKIPNKFLDYNSVQEYKESGKYLTYES